MSTAVAVVSSHEKTPVATASVLNAATAQLDTPARLSVTFKPFFRDH
jgi:hypothetical protein